MTRTFSLVLLAMLITVTLTSMLEGDMGDDIPSRSPDTPQWAMPGGGPGNSHNISMNYSGLEPYIRWSAEALTYHDARCGSPVISADGDIYYTRGPEVFKVDSEGELIWSLDISSGEETWNLSDPALDRDGNIIVWYGDGFLYSIDPEGEIKWTHITDRLVSDGMVHPVPVGDHLYFSGTYRLYVFKLTGETEQEIEIYPGNLTYSPVVDRNGTIYLATSVNELIAYHNNGTLSWTHPMNGDISSPPTIRGDGSIYICDTGPLSLSLHCILGNGTTAWSVQFSNGNNLDQSIAVDESGNAYLYIAFTNMNNGVYCVNSTGSKVRQIPVNDHPLGPVEISDNGTIFLQMVDYIRILEVYGTRDSTLSIPPSTYGVGGMAFDLLGNIYLSRGTLFCIGMSGNPPPSFIGGRIEDQFIDEDNDLILDLYRQFSDAEDLVFDHECNNPTFNITIYEDLLHVRFPANYSGEGNVRIKATNRGNDDVSGTPDDNTTWTNWFRVEVSPVNDPPLLLMDRIPDASEGLLYQHQLKIMDSDSNAEHTTVMVLDINWLYARGLFLEGTPPKNGAWREEFTILLMDEDGAISRYEDLEILVNNINDPPVINEEDLLITIPEDFWKNIEIGSYYRDDIHVSDPDVDDLIFDITLGDHLEIKDRIDSHDRIEFDIRAEQDWNGETNITLSVSDGEFIIDFVIDVTVLASEDRVRNLTIVPLSSLVDVDDGTMITLTVNFTDPDGFESSDYDYYWESGYHCLGMDRTISFRLEPGTHNISVGVRKENRDYKWIEEEYQITVADDGKDGVDEEEEDGEVEEYPDREKRYLEAVRNVTMIHILIYCFFLMVPLFSFLIHLLIRKTRSGNDPLNGHSNKDGGVNK